jgi:two-component system, chemotaxis family, CheB/CheR fusion protein
MKMNGLSRPHDAHRSVRDDTFDFLTSDVHVTEELHWPAREEPVTPHAKLRPPGADLEAADDRCRTLVADLSRENDDVNRALEGPTIATILLDRRLNVVWFTPAARAIAHNRMAEVVAEVRSVLDTNRPKRVNIQANDGRWYEMEICVYHALDGAVGGVAISFVDVTRHRRAEQDAAIRLAHKETLLQEVHHRVRNNMASIVGLLSIQADSLSDSEAQLALQSAIGRVASMSVLYDKLLVSPQYGAGSVKDYLEDLADTVVEVFPTGANATLKKRIADFDVGTDTLFLLGLITNELLTNSLKYAFHGHTGGTITLILERSGNRVTLIVQDDGAGLPPGFDPESNTGFGLTLVKSLSGQLGGSFSISTRNGTRSVLEFAF